MPGYADQYARLHARPGDNDLQIRKHKSLQIWKVPRKQKKQSKEFTNVLLLRARRNRRLVWGWAWKGQCGRQRHLSKMSLVLHRSARAFKKKNIYQIRRRLPAAVCCRVSEVGLRDAGKDIGPLWVVFQPDQSRTKTKNVTKYKTSLRNHRGTNLSGWQVLKHQRELYNGIRCSRLSSRQEGCCYQKLGHISFCWRWINQTFQLSPCKNKDSLFEREKIKHPEISDSKTWNSSNSLFTHHI